MDYNKGKMSCGDCQHKDLRCCGHGDYRNFCDLTNEWVDGEIRESLCPLRQPNYLQENIGSIPVMNMIKSDMFEMPTIFIPSKDYDDISEMIIEALNQLKE